MKRLEQKKLERESNFLQERIIQAKLEIEKIRSDYDYLDPEILDVLSYPFQQEIDQLREQLIPVLLKRFLLLSEEAQDRVLEAVTKEDERMRGECH